MSAPVLNSTPLKPALPGIAEFKHIIADLAKAQEEHAKEMAGHWGGPVTPRVFVDNFMSLDDANLQKMMEQMTELLPNAKFKLPVRKGQRKLEKHLYQLFVSHPYARWADDSLIMFVGYIAGKDHQRFQSLPQPEVLHRC